LTAGSYETVICALYGCDKLFVWLPEEIGSREMESIQQISSPTFLGNEQIASVNYRVCNLCGFRLMRIETTIINAQHLVVERCPICEQTRNAKANDESQASRIQLFDLWLATHGLDRNTLERHYHLRIDDFFDEVK
jgi:hypothetical protein